MWEVSATDIDLGKVDFAAVARAYKIIYFYSIGKSRILDLLFNAKEDEELEQWDADETKEVSSEMRDRYNMWFVENMERSEVKLAYMIVKGESRDSVTYKTVIDNMFRVPENERMAPEQTIENHRQLMQKITARKAGTDERKKPEKVYT